MLQHKTKSYVKKETAKRILNCLPSQMPEKDWVFDNALAAGILEKKTPLPDSIDLRETWWNVGDQKDTGSCVGWATADSVLRWHLVKAKRLPEETLLSPRFIWMAAKETDEFDLRPTTFIELDGTSLKAALDIARKYGAVTDDILPFLSNRLYRGDEKTFYAIASRFKIANYFNLGKNIIDWKSWLAVNGPILTRLMVDITWENATMTKGLLDMYQPEMVYGGHAVAIVGYTTDRFIIRNSWGEDWGDKGFAYASIGYAQAAFTEAYGISL